MDIKNDPSNIRLRANLFRAASDPRLARKTAQYLMATFIILFSVGCGLGFLAAYLVMR